MRGPVVVLVALLLTGCASRSTARRLDTDLGAVRIGLAELQEEQHRGARTVAKTADDLRALDGQVGELRAGIQQATDELVKLRARLEATDDAVRQTRAEIDALPARLAPPPRPPEPERPKEAAVTVGNAEEAFARALAAFHAREHGQAVLDFMDFIARYPRHPLVPQAQYWIGEAYFVQRDWRQAIVEFARMLEQGPATPKAPEALLKVGICYTNLRDVDRARQAWQRLRQDYPGSEAAARARALLNSRGATSRP